MLDCEVNHRVDAAINREGTRTRLLHRAGAAVLSAGGAPERGREPADRVRIEVLEKQAANAANVSAAGVAELRETLVGQMRVRHARIVRARDALDESAGDEAVDKAGDPRAGEHRALGKRGHRQL